MPTTGGDVHGPPVAGGAAIGIGGPPGSPPATRAMSFAPVCHDDSWVAGTTEWCDGTFVHRDHVYDDAGADTGDPAVLAWDTTGTVDHRTRGRRASRS